MILIVENNDKFSIFNDNEENTKAIEGIMIADI